MLSYFVIQKDKVSNIWKLSDNPFTYNRYNVAHRIKVNEHTFHVVIS